MAASPPHSLYLPPESRAPPPSPVGKPPKENELTEFLTRSLGVPKLVLPDRIFPLEATSIDPPVIDMASIISPEDCRYALDIIKIAAASIGCFQIVNHGISDDVIGSVEAAAAALFRLSPVKKKAVAKSPERKWGFEVEEEEGEGESEGEEFFWWCGEREEELAGIWPNGYGDFSDKLQLLWLATEKIASKIGEIILENSWNYGAPSMPRREGGSVLCLHKHRPNNTSSNVQEGHPRHDMLSTLIRNSGRSNALSLHIYRGSSAFHVYSKRGWMTFGPSDGALVVTTGDQIQAWSAGLYKCVVGKTVFYSEGNTEGPISIAFLYFHPAFTVSTSCTAAGKEKTISLCHQIMLAICLALLYHIIVYMYGDA